MRLPSFLNLRRLEGRIVGLFLALLLAVQLASFAFIRSSIERNADTAIAAELKTGERVFRRLLVQEAEKRSDSAALLAQDYGFKRAIGLALAQADTETVETIKDALANQGQRIGASVVAYFDTRLKLVASTRDDAGRFAELLKQKTAAGADPRQGDDDVQLALLDGRAYQVVAVPVHTPAPAGWILMGFALDGAALKDLRSLSELQGVVVVRNDGRHWTPLVSSIEREEAALLSAQIPTASGLFPADVGGEQWRGRLAPLEREQQYRLGVVLLRSFDAAIAPYRSLQLILLALTVVGALVFALLSVLLARRISGPIRALSESAERLGRGDYDTPILSTARDEVGELARAFELMRQGIRTQTAKAERLAYWDELTGLPNRARFRTALEQQLASRRPFAVLMLNLDRFKHVNDVLGHDFGDALLQGVGLRLQQLGAAHPAHATQLARVGGDQFALALDGAGESAALAMAAAILQDFVRPLRIGSHTVDLSAGIGIALHPRDGADAMQLLSRAELAMHAAKQRQCGSLAYNAQLDAASPASLSLLSDLRRAIDDQELRLYLQPKVELKSGRVISAEALVRWQHPSGGLVPPAQFIPFAEQTGFIRELTQWVIAEAARAWRAAADAGINLPLSINLSTRDLMDQELPGKIAALIAEFEVAPGALCLEITETAIMLDQQRARSTLQQLSSMGFKLSIDDFGTGHSSLAYLKDLPVDELKIDMSFVKAMASSRADRRIVRSTIELAHNLDLSVVAEGIETAEAWQLLAKYGCDEGQGFFVSRPMPHAQFVAWLAGWQPPALGEALPDTAFSELG
ncbi:putative bifunctional diguanylate cyclase/phosphodiesterase [Roseateles violae]|uniref:EAL domain-containing protein n=1 Tax=Roseateles violae TaxID=3058042 RepID=A0ABT8DRQ6_9BURK|nr:EAL domain-containing protein [Pelomonas sp. PFR6]MDN3918811.1 EAL domain-containing protein [Pelomonas sp. PFR6]